jgi:hypothetical protein
MKTCRKSGRCFLVKTISGCDAWRSRLQLSAKSETDVHLLTQAIEYDLTTDEFFIQKAIGWALRQYARSDAQWVKAFIHAHPELSKLAVREAIKTPLKKLTCAQLIPAFRLGLWSILRYNI